MGITIHYRLELSDRGQLAAVLAAARQFALARGWPVHEIADAPFGPTSTFPFGTREHAGPGTGVAIAPDEYCEPVLLVFDTDLVASASTKTEYAGSEVHTEVVALLDALTPHVASMDVTDEAEFWPARDPSALRRRMMTRAELREERRLRAADARNGNGRLAWRRPS